MREILAIEMSQKVREVESVVLSPCRAESE
jgi:hypothetical protein